MRKIIRKYDGEIVFTICVLSTIAMAVGLAIMNAALISCGFLGFLAIIMFVTFIWED